MFFTDLGALNNVLHPLALRETIISDFIVWQERATFN